MSLPETVEFLLLSKNATNSTDTNLPGGYDPELQVEDTNWILTSSFIIFTMQTGFGMLESGCVSIKNEVNIMMKNVVDIVLGGLTYWMFGYGLSFGTGPWTNPLVAIGGFCVDPHVGDELMGPVFAAFLFQLSFATTATTIVSGAMAERCDFKAYCIFSLLNTVVYCIPAGWVWGEHGFLYHLGAVDIAGSGPVHLIGGSAAFASAAMLGPRLGRYSQGRAPLPPGSPVNAILGLFVLWWGWLAFNSGSTYGVSGAKWQYAARAAVMTMMGSFGGGCFGLAYSLVRFKGGVDLIDLINSVLGALVAITAGCFLYRAWEALLIGVVGGAVACLTMPLVDRLGVDDPVGASSVHGFSGIWGVIAVGLFADNPVPLDTTRGRSGLFKGGGWYLLGVQSLSALCLATWGLLSTSLLLWIVGRFRHIRMTVKEELLGADLTEHMIMHKRDDIDMALKILKPYMELGNLKDTLPIGSNHGHKIYMAATYPSPVLAAGKNDALKTKAVLNFPDDFQRAEGIPIKLYNSQMFMKSKNKKSKNSKMAVSVIGENDSERSDLNDIVQYNGDNYTVLRLPRIKLQPRFNKNKDGSKMTNRFAGSNLNAKTLFSRYRGKNVIDENTKEHNVNKMSWVD